MKGIMRGAGVLAACSLVGKALGALYRLPLVSIIGDEGTGVYQLATAVYALFFTLACGGLPVAVSRFVAADHETERLASIIVWISGAIGLVFGAVFAALSPLFAAVQGNSAAAAAYLAVAPALVFATVLSGLRGYFQGKGNLLPTSLSQLVEQAVKLVVGLWLARVFASRGAASGAVGALLGVSVSEIVASGAVALFFAIKPQKTTKRQLKAAEHTGNLLASSPLEAATDVAIDGYGINNKTADKKQNPRRIPRKTEVKSVAKAIISAAVPITLGALVMPLTGVADSLTVVNILSARGLSAAEATACYGLLGAVNTLVNLPVTISYAFAVALLPKVAGAKTAAVADGEIRFVTRLALIFSAFCAAFYVIFARDIVAFLYPSLSPRSASLTVTLLRAEAPAVMYSSLLGVATAALQGSGKSGLAARNLAIGGAIKVAVSVILLRFTGAVGASAGTVACYAATLVLDLIGLRAFRSVTLGRAAGTFAAIAVGIAVTEIAALALTGAAPIARLAIGLTAGAAATYALCGRAFGREERIRLPFFKH